MYSWMMALWVLGVADVGVGLAWQVWLSYLGRASGFVAGVCLGCVVFLAGLGL